MESVVKKLLTLQSLDGEIDRLEKDSRLFPTKLAELKGKEAAHLKILADSQARLELIERERRDLESSLALEEERLRKSRKKLSELKKDYEYRAMVREIEGTKRSNSELEEKVLAKLAEIDVAKRALDQAETEVRTVQEEIEKSRPEVEGKSAEYEGILRVKYEERTEAEKGIDVSILSRYRKIRDKKHRDTVVQVVNYSCQGCFLNVPPQMVNEMLRRKTIEHCPSCHRLIFVEPAAVAT